MLIQELLTIDKSKLVKWGNDFVTSIFDIINKNFSPDKLPFLKMKNPVKKITKQGIHTDSLMMEFKTSVKDVDVEFILDFVDNYLVMVTCEFADGRTDVDGWNGHTEIDVNFNTDKITAKKAAEKYFNIKHRSLSSNLNMFY